MSEGERLQYEAQIKELEAENERLCKTLGDVCDSQAKVPKSEWQELQALNERYRAALLKIAEMSQSISRDECGEIARKALDHETAS